MFPVSAVADNNTRANVQQDCVALAQYMANKGWTSKMMGLGEKQNKIRARQRNRKKNLCKTKKKKLEKQFVQGKKVFKKISMQGRKSSW